MEYNADKYKTPHKLGKPILSGSGKAGDYNCRSVDAPFVFYHNGKTYIMHIGDDGKGYQTALSSSGDPASGFTLEGVILKKGEGNEWDDLNAAGTWMLCEEDINKTRTLKKYKGKYWLTYHSYPGEGYETGPASIGMAYTEDETLINWTRLEAPVLTPCQGQAWEAGGLYKSCIVTCNDIFFMYYNAKNKGDTWIEQIGVVTSTDLINWVRYDDNPVIRIAPDCFDSTYTSDPCVVRDGDLWLMFYYGYDGINAMNSVAFSRDLLNWEKLGWPLLAIGEQGQLDSMHAHKPCVYTFEGVLYHYYCACRAAQASDSAVGCFGEFRCLTVAANKPLER